MTKDLTSRRFQNSDSSGDLTWTLTAAQASAPSASQSHQDMQKLEIENRGKSASGLSSSSLLGSLWSCFSAFVLTPFADETGHPTQILRGFVTLFAVGIILGLTLPAQVHTHAYATSPFYALPTWCEYSTVSNIIGYTYTLCWSVAMYPQAISNYHRKTTKGLSVEFALLNLVGFACYSLYSTALLYNATILDVYQQQKSQANNQISAPMVKVNDVVFSIHVFILSAFMCAQMLVYNGLVWARDVSPLIQWILGGMVTFAVGWPMYLLFAVKTREDSFMWLNYLYVLSFIKVVTTLIKFVPQTLLNWRRKSTKGWSIWRNLLDLMGGFLSTTQLLGDAADMGDWKAGVTGNPAKFGLGSISMVFALIFVYQHYILYPDRGAKRVQSQSKRNVELP